MRDWVRHSRFASVGLALCFLLVATESAPAFNRAEAIEECKRSVGRPIYLACMKGAGASHASCYESARPAARQCVLSKWRQSPQFRRWCTRPTGTYQNDKSFARREAVGCFREPAHDQHVNRLH